MWSLAIGILGLALLTLPGWWLARAGRLRAPVLAGFLGGALALVTLVLLLEILGRRLSSLNLAAGWTGWMLAAFLLSRRLARQNPTSGYEAPPTLAWSRLWPWLLALPVLGAACYRVTAEPLFGPDTSFRWEYLARQMWQRETLSFYPPVSAADFEAYFWADGIPPLVSSVYFGLYRLAGGIEITATIPVVAVQFALLLVGTGALAQRVFSPAAGAWSIALLGVTPLAAWSASMGQETGFTALAVVGLWLYLPQDRAEANPAAMIAAGAAAAVGALAREYGWAFVAFGLLLGWQRKLPLGSLGWYAGVVAVTAVPWYARNFALTGNPLFNLSVGGIFPVNEAHLALMNLYREHFSLGRELGDRGLVPFLNCAAVLLAGGAGIVLGFRRGRPLILGILLAAALWILSVPYTAAGFMNALRVLSPALALGAVLGGAALAAWAFTARRKTMACVLLVLIGIDGAVRTLVLPFRPWRRPPAAEYSRWDARRQQEEFADVLRHVGHRRLLALGYNDVLGKLGVVSVPPWSPDVVFLFDRGRTAEAVWQGLTAAGISHVLVMKSEFNQRYLGNSPAFAAATPGELRPVLDRDLFVLFAITTPPAASPGN